MKAINIKIADDVHEAISREAESQGTSKTEIMRRILCKHYGFKYVPRAKISRAVECMDVIKLALRKRIGDTVTDSEMIRGINYFTPNHFAALKKTKGVGLCARN